jgi:hypothetical protein
MTLARIALGEFASAFCCRPLTAQPPITTTHQRPPLSQRGQCGAVLKGPHFRRASTTTIRNRAAGRGGTTAALRVFDGHGSLTLLHVLRNL